MILFSTVRAAETDMKEELKEKIQQKQVRNKIFVIDNDKYKDSTV